MSRRNGDHYEVSEEEKARFARDGYVHLRGILSEQEMAAIEVVYEQFLRGEIEVPGKDYCDMSGDYDKSADDYAIVNVMLPRRYYPAWCGNPLERRGASIAGQLCGPGMTIDFDQLLAKRPQKDDAVFAWHQDQAYWPVTRDSRTATLWLALDDSTVENGCMRFIPGSHLEPELRKHRPMAGDREKSHTLVAEVDETVDQVRPAEIRRGDVTVHSERVTHGSGGNSSAGWRRAYSVAFRSTETVAEGRQRGFTHSHNDAPGVLDDVGIEGESRDP